MFRSYARTRGPSLALCLLACEGLYGCSSEGGTRESRIRGGGADGDSNASSTSAGTEGSGGATSGGVNGTSNSATGGGAAPTIPLPMGSDPAALIPARIRRLSNAEYDASAAHLLGTTERPGDSFAPDARQDGFTVNDAQRVDAVLVKQLFAAAETLATEARPRLGELAPCDTPNEPEACATAFIESFGARAYRRPLDGEESSGLLGVFRTGAEGQSYEDGIELVVRALLQSAGFLYLTELGSGAPDDSGALSLTPYELASSLSYLLTAGPPDQALTEAALSGRLATAEGRVDELLRLRSEYPGESNLRLVRLIREWLSLDRIEGTAKDTNVYGEFEAVKSAVVAESHDFVRAVLEQSSGSVSDLLGADWTVTSDSALLGLYAAEPGTAGRASLPDRRGILNQGAFLAVHAHAHESTPVLRGVAVARRIACLEIPSPASLSVNVVPPVPDPSLTTRERFEVHTTDTSCAQCHQFIDPFGNAFEQFDGMGKYRDTENGRPVDSSTVIEVGADFDGSYADSNQLAEALATSALVRSCFARHLFRAAIARSDASVQPAEDAFVADLEALPTEQQGNVMDSLITLVSGPLFTHRRTP